MTLQEDNSPTLSDTPKNRIVYFVESCITLFNEATKINLLNSKSKDNVDANERQLNCIKEGTEAGALKTGIIVSSSLPVFGPLFAGVAAFSGKMLKQWVEETFKKSKHESAKMIEKYFAGYCEEKKKWTEILIDTFLDIFINFNTQVSDFYQVTRIHISVYNWRARIISFSILNFDFSWTFTAP